MLGVLIDNKLTFKNHVSMWKSKSKKVHALVRVSNYMSKEKTKDSYECIFNLIKWICSFSLDVS